MRRIGHPPSALSRDRRTRGASGVVRGHIATATLAVVRPYLRLAFRHVPTSIRHHARGVVSVDASHSGKYSLDLLSLAPPKKTPNKASHPTPTRWAVRRFLASILIFGLHSLRASIRGGWTQRSALIDRPIRLLFRPIPIAFDVPHLSFHDRSAVFADKPERIPQLFNFCPLINEC